MARKSEHPGVFITQKTQGGDFKLRFWLGDKFKAWSPGTNSFEKATAVAVQISSILHNNMEAPSGTDEAILDALGLTGKRKEISKEAMSGYDRYLDERGKAERPLGAMTPEPESAYIQTLLNALRRTEAYAKELERKLLAAETASVAATRNEREALQKVAAYEALQIRDGKKLLKDNAPKSLRMAIDEYVLTMQAGERYRQTVSEYLTQFAKEMDQKTAAPNLDGLPHSEKLALRTAYNKNAGTRIDVGELKPEKVQDYLEGLSKRLAGSTLDQHFTAIRACLNRATGKRFEFAKIENWIMPLIEKRQKAADDWFWLVNGQAMATIERMRKEDEAGSYWADAALIQYRLGLRPEELCLLQSQYVNRDENGKIESVYISPIKENGVIIRSVKTDASAAAVSVEAEDARQALERRLATGSRFLFPHNPKECGVRAPRLAGRTRRKMEIRELKEPEFAARLVFLRSHLVWEPRTWDRQFLKRLRSAAAKVGGIEVDRVDSRTLRRTCGREIIVRTKSIEAAAAKLRDDPATIRRHYGRLLANDRI